ncbi:hypothetical protein FOA52_008695 [Chlamydomonas sp. UWO 241]|nr:hypothetical protein FOA52_009834 [Chlamydomonas sp. UWO 241]KAG1658993.1 hypothetical protein FOA52_008695 [Chlamydomonas sp. UWO 241]
MLTLTSYVLFLLIALECIVVATISRAHVHRRRMAAIATIAAPGDASKQRAFAWTRRLFAKFRLAPKAAADAPKLDDLLDETSPRFDLSGDGGGKPGDPGALGLTRDEAWALLLAAKIDTWSCAALLVMYVLVVIIILTVGAAVGDHKLMLGGGVPGNA